MKQAGGEMEKIGKESSWNLYFLSTSFSSLFLLHFSHTFPLFHSSSPHFPPHLLPQRKLLILFLRLRKCTKPKRKLRWQIKCYEGKRYDGNYYERSGKQIRINTWVPQHSWRKRRLEVIIGWRKMDEIKKRNRCEVLWLISISHSAHGR